MYLEGDSSHQTIMVFMFLSLGFCVSELALLCSLNGFGVGFLWVCVFVFWSMLRLYCEHIVFDFEFSVFVFEFEFVGVCIFVLNFLI